MDICTVSQFLYAIAHPEESFTALACCVAEQQSIHCGKHFVECMVTLDGQRALISAPITHNAMRHIMLTDTLFRSVGYPLLRRHTLPYELLTDGISGRRCSIVIEDMNDTMTLDEATKYYTASELREALNRFRDTMQRLDISLNNLLIENIAIGRGCEIIPIRSLYATRGYGGDLRSIESIERRILAPRNNEPASCDTLHEPLSAYDTTTSSQLHDGLRRTANERGVGFEDEWGNLVIECRYREVSDFLEGRSTVTTHEGKMGLINTSGKEIIATIYDTVKYDISNGSSWVSLDGKWALFDYFGLQITDWQEQDAYDEDSHYLSL